MTLKFAVIDCEDDPEWKGHENYFISQLKRDNEEWKTFRAYLGELPDPNSEEYKGIIITGSHYCTYEKKDWMESLFDYIRQFTSRQNSCKMYASCFGCQTVAHALGGRVGKHPSGTEILKCEKIFPTERFYQQSWAQGIFNDTSVPLVVLESHGDCVLTLPEGSELLASSHSTPIELFVIGNKLLAFQGHPEWGVNVITDKILHQREEENPPISKQAKMMTLDSLQYFSLTAHQQWMQLVSNFLRDNSNN